MVILSVVFTGKKHSICFYQRSRSEEQDDSSAKNSLFPRSARAASIQENGRKRANRHWMGSDGSNFTHPLYFLPLPRFWISIFGMEQGHLGHFVPFTSWISIFGNELHLSLPCLELDVCCGLLCLLAFCGRSLSSYRVFLPLLCLWSLHPPLDKLAIDKNGKLENSIFGIEL